MERKNLHEKLFAEKRSRTKGKRNRYEKGSTYNIVKVQYVISHLKQNKKEIS